MKLLILVARTLDRAGVPFALAGASALATYGVVRSTLAIDLLTTETRVLDPALWEGLGATGARADIRCGDADDPLAGVVRFELPGERPVDLVIGRSAWQREAIERAEPLLIEGLQVRVLRPADLVLLKLYAGAPHDLRDIELLLARVDRDAVAGEVERRLDALAVGARDLRRRLRAS